ncbi:MAG: glycoside hydrolase, partial [Ruminococcus sp.]|nr:glycoside hydrolase [Ruminococcus sp.]
HHTFWCFNENSSDTGGLVYDNFQKWDDVKYEFVKPALWQDANGKFISLDHKIPLGRAGNGISLFDYYGNSCSQIPQTTTTTATAPSTTTTTADTTTTTVTTSTTTATTISEPAGTVTLYGDANCNGEVEMSDAVLIMQKIANPTKYGVDGTDENRITEQGLINADCAGGGDGVTNLDALTIQKYMLKLVDKLPVA